MRMGTDEDEDTTEDVCDEIEGVCGRIIDTCEVRSGDRTTKGPEDKWTIGQRDGDEDEDETRTKTGAKTTHTEQVRGSRKSDEGRGKKGRREEKPELNHA